MPVQLADASELPLGGHAVSFHASQEEAADQAADFLAGAPAGQSASYWVAHAGLLEMYRNRVSARAPAYVRSVHVLAGPQVHRVDQKLRPVEEVLAFLERHPEGVTGGAETITWYWTREEIRDYLEYEHWFEAQPRAHCRFLCPYDLRRLPIDTASGVLRALSHDHSHLVLSRSRHAAVRVLQLLAFPTAPETPEASRAELSWAIEHGYLRVGEHTGSIDLTAAGEALLAAWRRE